MPPKILVISNYNDTIASRPEAELFIKLKKRGMDVNIMTPDGSYYANEFKKHGIRVIDYYPSKKYSLKSMRIIRNELVEGKYNIIHLFSNKATSNGIWAARKLPVKIVLYRGYTGNIHWWSPKSYLKYLNPRIDRIMCIAEATRDLIRSNLLKNKEKAIWIRKGHNPEWYKNIPKADLSEFGVKKDDIVFTNVSNFRTMKGIIYLIKALNYLPKNLPLKILLIGRNMNDKAILNEINQSPYKSNIILTGFRKDALELVKASDVFVLPSIKGEAITKAVIEAMSLGVAPVITNIPGNKNLVLDRENGLVIKKKDPKALAAAMLFLINNPDEREKFGQKAKAYMETHFNHEQTVEQVYAMYHELIPA